MLTTNKNALRLLVLVALLASLGCPKRIQLPKELPENFTRIEIEHNGFTVLHPLYVPPEYTPDETWPLIVWLHGAGERGLDGLLPANGALASQVKLHPERFPCLVLFPQAPFGYVWGARKEPFTQLLPDASPILDQAIDTVMADYNIDPDRVTLTGISMGAYGVFYYGAANADRFAALMPLAGAGWLDDAHKLKDTPVWAFHGEEDLAVPAADAIAMIEAINAAGGNAWLTLYPGERHDIWAKTYSEPAVIQWLLAQRRPSPKIN